jgi:hypothetical protein
LESVAAALDGCYGAWVNTDTYTVGEQKEIFAGIKIYETARRTPAARHLIWSNLDYGSKVFSPSKGGVASKFISSLQLGNYNPIYKAEHHDAKGIVCEYLKGQPSVLGDGLTWTSITSGVYLEMLNYVCSRVPQLSPLISYLL